MKKFITICITLALVVALAPAAFAEWDLSDLTFDDLIALRAQTQYEMMNRPEWEEVEVPQGVYKVGEDIPAGTWTILCKSGIGTSIYVGDNLSPAGTELKYPYKAYETIYNPAASSVGSGYCFEWAVTLHDGEYLSVGSNSAVFTTYAGKPSLGFKK